jgi:DnaJ-class molecular chaperone
MTGGGQVGPYVELDVSRDVSRVESRRAYRQVARRHHPDVKQDPGGPERFAAAARAFEMLSDPAARARYEYRFPDLSDPPSVHTTTRGRPARSPRPDRSGDAIHISGTHSPG